MGKIVRLVTGHRSLIETALLFVFVLVLLLLSTPVGAQSVSRGEVSKLLLNRYAERPISRGLANNGGVVEVFATQDGSTWTIVLTMPDGMSRVIGSGESWASIPARFGSPIYYRLAH